MTPQSKVVVRDEHDWESDGGGMEFRLTYERELCASNTGREHKPARKAHKHAIRKQFHRQLKRLFEVTPLLKTGSHSGPGLEGYAETTLPKYDKDKIAAAHQMYGFTFLPLVTAELKLACWLDILFLRRQGRGDIWHHGDIDNRLKTLLDALQVPDANQDYHLMTPEADETPFYCLLQDDNLVSKITVESDLLLEDLPNKQPDENDARLIITVRIRPHEVTLQNILFS